MGTCRSSLHAHNLQGTQDEELCTAPSTVCLEVCSAHSFPACMLQSSLEISPPLPCPVSAVPWDVRGAAQSPPINLPALYLIYFDAFSYFFFQIGRQPGTLWINRPIGMVL